MYREVYCTAVECGGDMVVEVEVVVGVGGLESGDWWLLLH